jgi:hypothetical protein
MCPEKSNCAELLIELLLELLTELGIEYIDWLLILLLLDSEIKSIKSFFGEVSLISC